MIYGFGNITLEVVRNILKKYLNKYKIQLTGGVYNIPIHKQKPYKNGQILENTDTLSDEVISLPIHTELESSNQDFIIDKITKYFK